MYAIFKPLFLAEIYVHKQISHQVLLGFTLIFVFVFCNYRFRTKYILLPTTLMGHRLENNPVIKYQS
jgi:hypothetical protein